MKILRPQISRFKFTRQETNSSFFMDRFVFPSIIFGFLGLALTAPGVLHADTRDDAIFGEDAKAAPAASQNGTQSEPAKTQTEQKPNGEGSNNSGSDVYSGSKASSQGDGLSNFKPTEIKAEEPTYTLGGKALIEASSAGRSRKNASQATVQARQQLDLFLDSTAQSWRFLVKGTLDKNTKETNYQTREFWAKWNNQSLFLTLGQQPLKWGVGRIWNPTDFLASQVKDPFATEDRRAGLWLVKLHVPLESSGSNIYAILNGNNVKKANDFGGALRGEFVLGNSEITLTAAQKYKQGLQLGSDLSTGIGPFDFQVEAAFTNRPTQVVYIEAPSAANQGKATTEKNKKWESQWVTGVEYGVNYSDADAIYFGYEYFINPLGQTNFANETYAFLSGTGRPFYLGKRYWAAYVRLPNPGDWNSFNTIATVIYNKTDRTGISRLSLDWSTTPRVNVGLYGVRYLGTTGEFRFQLPETFSPAPDSTASPISKERAEELKQNPLRWETGINLAINF